MDSASSRKSKTSPSSGAQSSRAVTAPRPTCAAAHPAVTAGRTAATHAITRRRRPSTQGTATATTA
ncbi:hypothetical protein ACFQY7_55855 [Actinomadura luteofluorescens]|uniref:hypothetical protein n=1 Tax=Actinomadura luteofluorescens TaxID=46163 RepID=UPI00363934D9